MSATELNPGRTLVLCFDGTSNEFDGDNTNVVKLLALLRKDQPHKQLVFYQPGIGTFAKPGIFSPLMLWIAQMVDMAIAWYLDEHVLGGYMFLMQNYRAGDKIVMFGFSRGAYVVRALAGMLHKVGLLPPGNLHHAPFAYKLYRSNDKLGFERSAAFKRCFTPAQPVEIEFLGLWDTVASVGMITPRRLPFTSSNSTVRTFRHALSLDERRARFRPTLWAHSHHHPSADAPKRKPTLKQKFAELRTKAVRRSTIRAAPSSPTPPSLHIIPETESPVDITESVTTPPSSSTTGGRSLPRQEHARLPGTSSTADEPVDLPAVPPGTGSPERRQDRSKSVAFPDAPPEKAAPESGAAGRKKFTGLQRLLLGGMRLALPWRKTKKSTNQSRSNTAEQQRVLEDQYDEGETSRRHCASEDSDDISFNDTDRWRAHAGSPGSQRLTNRRRTDVCEVWFAGDHCDVGGGNAPDTEPHPLSEIPLHWMVREVIRAQAGVQWDHAAFARTNMVLPAFGLTATPRSTYHQLPPHGQHHRSESEAQFLPWNRQTEPHSGAGLGLSVDAPQVEDTTPNLGRTVSQQANYEPQHQISFASHAGTPIPDSERNRTSVRPQQQLYPHSDSVLTVRPDHHVLATSFQLPRAPSSSTLQLNAYGSAAVAESGDQLQVKGFMSITWWILEIFPAVYWYQNAKGHWKKSKRPNLGKPRRLPLGAKLHESVKHRMEQKPGYLPRMWDTRRDEDVVFVF
ncbi:hypothetical protein BKA62DRAFT_833227 [Auriculariales sp. MPI-PUGE-AT-0066]|nr:hypothetical protein BKA62DRAFT_833227 [Auriculariales sp. MPI-PUGE-AT-0066]